MGWIYRRSDQHQCALPLLDEEVKPGDLWRCDEVDCRKTWIVRDSQLDGMHID